MRDFCIEKNDGSSWQLRCAMFGLKNSGQLRRDSWQLRWGGGGNEAALQGELLGGRGGIPAAAYEEGAQG
jgi:hypothetical protein